MEDKPEIRTQPAAGPAQIKRPAADYPFATANVLFAFLPTTGLRPEER